MKVAVFFLSIFFQSAEQLTNHSDFGLYAIESIIESHLQTQSGKVDIVTCASSTHLATRFIRRYQLNTSSFLSINLKTCDTKEIRLEASTVLIFDSLREFKEIFPKIVWKTSFWRSHNHLVYVPDATIRDLDESAMIGCHIDNTAFLVNKNEKSIDLATSFYFTEKKCRDNQFRTINRFDKGSLEWECDNFYPRKYRNFHKCSLTIGVVEKYIMISFDIVVRNMSKLLNFEPKAFKHETSEDLVTRDDKIHFDLIRKPAAFDWQFIVLNFESARFFVPSGRPLDEVEKLLLPFDHETWFWIVGTLMFNFVVIMTISLLSKRTKDLCFGKNVDSPAINLLNIFFCGGQTRVPENSWARLIFLTFIIWSLIIRTCFQSLSYRALQMDNRHPPLKTMEDLLDSGFHLLAPLHQRRGLNKQYGFGENLFI